MENNTIQKMEIKRFYVLLVRTILGALFIGVLIARKIYFDNYGIHQPYDWYFPFLVVAFGIIQLRAYFLLERIKGDRELAGALDGDIYKIYNYKALATGFHAAFIVSMFLFLFAEVLNLSAPVCCMIIVTMSHFSSEVRRLILYKPW